MISRKLDDGKRDERSEKRESFVHTHKSQVDLLVPMVHLNQVPYLGYLNVMLDEFRPQQLK